jgi:EF hand
MHNLGKPIPAMLCAAALFSVGFVLAQSTANVPKPQDKVALGQDEVKQLLLPMDTDRNGKISKREYMKFMEFEFDRLDTDRSGELDVKELIQSRLRVSHPPALGK